MLFDLCDLYLVPSLYKIDTKSHTLWKYWSLSVQLPAANGQFYPWEVMISNFDG